MNVLQICSYYAGRKRLYDQFNRSVGEVGVDSTFYVPTKADLIISSDESNVIESVCFSNIDRLFFFQKHRRIFKDVQQKIDVVSFDLFHAHSLFSNGYIAYKLSKKYNIPYVVAVRNTDLNLFYRYMIHLRPLGNRILKDATAVIFFNEAYRDKTINTYVPLKWREEIRAKSRVIPNGIDSFWLENKYLRETQRDSGCVRLVYAGEINRNKTLTASLEACRILIKRGYAVHYLAVGNILDKKVAVQLAEAPFAEHRDRCPKEQLISFYRNSDVFLMPSITETFGLVYAEAMTQGLPVVYTRGQGFDRQFEEGAVGYSVDCHNPQEIADRILDCIGRYEEISSNCVSLCDKFNWDTIAQQYLELYSRIAGCAEHE